MQRSDFDLDDAAEIEAFDAELESALMSGDRESIEILLRRAEDKIGGPVEDLEFDGF